MYKYVQKHFLKENVCALQVFLRVLISRPLCAQLRGNIGHKEKLHLYDTKVNFFPNSYSMWQVPR